MLWTRQWERGSAEARSDAQTAGRICAIAKADPRIFGLPFSTWSLSKLRDHLLEMKEVATVSVETLRRLLRAGGVSWQATKTWKAYQRPRVRAEECAVSWTFTIARQPTDASSAWMSSGR